MIPKIIKIIASIIVFFLGVYQLSESYIGNGIFCFFISLFFILVYFKNELIFLAFLRLRKQDFEGTKKWLSRITNPELQLVKKQQGYYHYLHGIILSQSNLNQAEKHFKLAIKFGLSMSADLAMTKMSLAGILMQKRRKREAIDLLTQAKKLDKHGMLTEQIRILQSQLKRI